MAPAAAAAGVPEALIPTVIGILLGPGPSVLATIPGITPEMIGAVLPAYRQASSIAYVQILVMHFSSFH